MRASLKRANEISRSIGKQSGQAMSEFLVTVAFAFLPLFVLVPTLGKIMDLQFQNQMAARYAVWERTVWFDNLSGENRDDFVVSGNKWESVAVRSEFEVGMAFLPLRDVEWDLRITRPRETCIRGAPQPRGTTVRRPIPAGGVSRWCHRSKVRRSRSLFFRDSWINLYL